MDFSIDQTEGRLGMTFDPAGDGNVMNNMVLSIMVERGSWWHNTTFGSRLHLIKKNTPDAKDRVVDYLKECLQWIIDLGRVDEFDYETERSLNRIKFRVTAWRSGRAVASFAHFVEVI